MLFLIAAVFYVYGLPGGNCMFVNGRFRLLAPGRSHVSGWFGGGGNFEMGVLFRILGMMV